jgi:hypothetical protein
MSVYVRERARVTMLTIHTQHSSTYLDVCSTAIEGEWNVVIGAARRYMPRRTPHMCAITYGWGWMLCIDTKHKHAHNSLYSVFLIFLRGHHAAGVVAQEI